MSWHFLIENFSFRTQLLLKELQTVSDASFNIVWTIYLPVFLFSKHAYYTAVCDAHSVRCIILNTVTVILFTHLINLMNSVLLNSNTHRTCSKVNAIESIASCFKRRDLVCSGKRILAVRTSILFLLLIYFPKHRYTCSNSVEQV